MKLKKTISLKCDKHAQFFSHDLVFFSQNDNTGTKMYEFLEMSCNKAISLALSALKGVLHS